MIVLMNLDWSSSQTAEIKLINPVNLFTHKEFTILTEVESFSGLVFMYSIKQKINRVSKL